MKKLSIHQRQQVLLVTLLVCYLGYNISKVYGFVLFPDEFGYWSYAARMAGYDWSNIVSLGSYYSYGYSLILFPIFKLCKDAVLAYRIAVVVNMLLLIAAFFLLQFLIKILFEEITAEQRSIISLFVVSYPTWLFYAKTTMTEIVIMFMYVSICILLYQYFLTNRTAVLAMLFMAFVYIYTVHMRTIAILIAGLLVLVLHFLKNMKNRRRILILGAIICGLICVGICVKIYVDMTIYRAANRETLNINSYAGQIQKVKYIFSVDGMCNLLISFAGKIVYLGLATYSLFYWGLYYAIKQSIYLIRNVRCRKKIEPQQYLGLFVLLATLGEILVISIFTIQPMRADEPTSGRYTEFLLPILVIMGICQVWKSLHVWRATLMIAIEQLPLLAVIVWKIGNAELTRFNGYFTLCLSYLYDGEHFEPKSFFIKAYICNMLLTVMVISILQIMKKKQKLEFLLIMMCALQIALANRMGSIYTDDYSITAYMDTFVADKISELQQEKQHRIIYIDDERWHLVSILQFMLREEKIEVLLRENGVFPTERLKEDDIVVVFYIDSHLEELEERYDKSMSNGHFTIFYNEE